MTLEDQNELIAIEWFKQGIKPTFSHAIFEELTAGYGKLDSLGFWEYQLPFPAEQWSKSN